MTPLTMAETGKPVSIKEICGKTETRQFLENLGLTPGSRITIICENKGNVIVSVRESRIAIGRETACMIMV